MASFILESSNIVAFTKRSKQNKVYGYWVDFAKLKAEKIQSNNVDDPIIADNSVLSPMTADDMNILIEYFQKAKEKPDSQGTESEPAINFVSANHVAPKEEILQKLYNIQERLYGEMRGNTLNSKRIKNSK